MFVFSGNFKFETGLFWVSVKIYMVCFVFNRWIVDCLNKIRVVQQTHRLKPSYLDNSKRKSNSFCESRGNDSHIGHAFLLFCCFVMAILAFQRYDSFTVFLCLINLPLFFLWNKDNNNFVWLKMGKWVTKCSVNILAPWTPGVSRKQNLQPKGMYTVDEEKGVGLLPGPLWTFLGREEGVGPPLWLEGVGLH